MKKFFFLFVMVSSGLLSAAQTFEGIVTMIPDFKTKPDSKNNMVFYIKGDNIAMEPTGSGPMNARMVGNKKTREYYMLIESEGKKIALNINMDQMMGMIAGANPSTLQNDDHPVRPSIKETGDTRVIDGYKCRQVLTEMKGTKSEMWVTKDVSLSIADLFFSPKSGAQFKGYESIQGMVLEAWTYDADGKISLSVKTIPQKKPVDDKMFVIPEGYEKMDMMQLIQAAQGDPEMMQKMMEMFGGDK